MTREPGRGSDQDPRGGEDAAADDLTPLDQVLMEYLESPEESRVEERERILSRHPELAAELRGHFAADDVLRGLAQGCSPPPPRLCGDHELVEELGHGGMGVIYRARHRGLGREVALKMVRRGEFASPAERHRFRMEIEAAAALDHPNIVPIYEVGDVDGQAYFTMKLLGGGSLRSRIRRLGKDCREAARWVESIARAVQYAHERGVLHRDLTPANILFDGDGRVYVTDFGLAKRLGADQSATADGAVVGTPRYMAPEQARGDRRAVSTSSDVYSLGAILYELLAGRAPFVGGSSVDVLRRVIEEEPVPPGRLRQGVPRDLETIALKCLEKRPELRYPSALALAEDLRLYLEGKPITARPATTLYRAAKWARRNPAAATLVLASLVALGALGAQGWRHGREMSLRAAELEKFLYATRMQQVFAALDDEKAGAALELLKFYGPGSGDESLRDLGWWHAMARSDQADWTLPCEQGVGLALVDGGRTLAAGDRSRGVWCWDLASGTRELISTGGPRSWTPLYCSFGPASGDASAFAVERAVWLVDVEKRAAKLLFDDGHQKDGVAVAPDASWIAFRILEPPDPQRDLQGGIILWDVVQKREVGVIAPNVKIESWAMSADGGTVAVGSGGTLTLWDVPTRSERRRIDATETVGTDAFLAPDGSLVALLGNLEGAVTVWDTRTDDQPQSLGSPHWNATAAAFSPDGRWLAAGAGDGSVRLWRLPRLELARTLFGHQSAVKHLALAADGSRLASWSEDQTVKVWDLSRERRAEARGAPGDIVWWAAFADGGETLVTSSEDFNLHVWDVEAGRLGGELAPRARIRLDRWKLAREVLSPDGRRFAASLPDAQVAIWRLSWDGGEGRAEEEAVLPPHEGVVRGITFSGDTTMLATAAARVGLSKSAVKIWRQDGQGPGWTLVRELAIDQRVEDMAFSPDRRWLAMVERSEPTLALADLHRGEVRAIFKAISGEAKGQGLLSVAFSRDSAVLASGGRDHAIRLWDVAGSRRGEPRLLATLSGHGQAVTYLDFSARDGRLISASDDGTARIWSFFHKAGETIGLESCILRARRGQVKAIALSPCGRTLAAAGGRQRAYGEVEVFYGAAAD